MRIKLSLKAAADTIVQFNYNQLIHAMILNKIEFADPEYAREIHDSRSFKFFTFSEIFIPKGKAEKEGLKVFSENVHLFLSSPNERFMKAFISGILCKPEVRIGSANFILETANVEPSTDFSSGRAKFRTISSIVSSTMEETGGIRRIKDLTPADTKFYENVCNNILRKYEKFYGCLPKDKSFSIKLVKPLKTRRIRIKDDFHIGNLMIFEAQGSTELLNFAYDCGFGEKNSMGFGMTEVIR